MTMMTPSSDLRVTASQDIAAIDQKPEKVLPGIKVSLPAN
jgi:hypothetical protein